jgi:hypothetical protein
MFRIGWVVTAIVVLFLVVDALMKLMQLPVVFATMQDMGWSAASVVPLGLILLGATILYAIPATSLFGAIVLTGYLGGAVATHARIGSPLVTHTLFGVYVGALVWLGLVLRDAGFRKALLGGKGITKER